jgi:phage tail-like protein
MVAAQGQGRTDPCGAQNFEVEIDDRAVGFAAVSGLGCEFDYADDGRLVTSRITEVTLRRGVTGDTALWSWARSVLDGEPRTRTVRVHLLDDHREAVCSWVLERARLKRWSGPALDAVDGTIAMEEVVLAAESVEQVVPG